MISVNGEPVPANGKTLLELLTGEGYDPERVAVERNEEIVPRGTFGQVVLEDGDALEVVQFVGGG